VSPLRARLAGNDEAPPPERGGGTERWLLTYSDMITLLLVLFVVLYSLSSLNAQKYAEFVKGVDKAFHGNVVQHKKGLIPGSGHGKNFPTTKSRPYASVSQIKTALVHALTKAGLITDVTITTNNEGLVEGFVAGKLFYAKDVAELTPLGNRVVDVTASVIRRYSNPVTVEGFADNEPIIGGPYQNNWALSAARAVYVVTRLNDTDLVDPKQLTTEGLGEFHPVVPNNSPSNQAQNRRVNIAIAGASGP
jgi:chemotaxis protein MotB